MPILQGGFGLFQSPENRTLTVPRQAQINIFDDVVVLEQDQYARQLGVYGDVSLGQNLEARFASFDTPQHLWSNRKNGCTWNPKGGMRMNVSTFPTCPIEFDGEQCPDAFYGTCFEQIFRPGMGVRDLYGTPESQAIMAAMLRRINQGLGNSFFALWNFANHPIITQANEEGFYRGSVANWTAYVDQMLSGDCGGIITQLDALKAMGEPGYTSDIPVNAAGNFTGTLQAIIDDLITQAGPEFSTMIENGATLNGRRFDVVCLATTQEFEQYRTWIGTMAATNELAYRYYLEYNDGTTKLMKNVLVYRNIPIIKWEAHTAFDAITGAKSHRVALLAPGVLGMLHDVPNLQQWDGMGLVVQQSQQIRDKGKVYMTTTLRWGAGISNVDFIRMASTIVLPPA